MAQTPKPQNPQINRAHPLARGLVAAWPMFEGGGGTLHDVAGQNHGTIYGAPEWEYSPGGRVIRFDRVDDYVSVPNAAAIDFTKNFTISFWCRRGSAAEDQPAQVLNKVRPGSGGGNDKQYMIKVFSKITFDYERSANNWYLQTGDVVPNDDSWNLVTVTMTDALLATIYFNGVFITSDTAPAETVSFSDPLQFSKLSYLGAFGGGRAHDIRMWSRVLGPSEIIELYSGDPWALYRRPLFGSPWALYIGGGSSDTVGADATAGFSDLLSLTSGLLSVPPLAATAGYKSVMSMCGVYIDSAGLPLPSGGGGKGVRRRRIPMVLFDDADDGIVINAALDSFGAI